MKILYVAHNVADASKGAAHADLALLAEMRARGHRVDDEWDIGAPRIVNHDNLHLLLEAPWKCARVVERRLSRERYDAILVNQPLGWRAGRWVSQEHPGTLYVARSHGWEPRVHEELQGVRNRPVHATGAVRRMASEILRTALFHQNDRVLDCADGLIVCSRDDRNWISRSSSFPAERVLALAPGLPREWLATPVEEMSPGRVRRLLYVGQFTPVKAPEIVAHVVCEVLRSRPETAATWVCAEGDHDKVRALIDAEVLPRLTVRSWMTRSELIRTYDASGVYLFPSYFEGFAQTFLEAMARGLVVVASHVSGAAETIHDGQNGFLYARGDVAGMTARIVGLVDNPTLAGDISRSARETSLGFTWERAALDVERFFERLRSMALSRLDRG